MMNADRTNLTYHKFLSELTHLLITQSGILHHHPDIEYQHMNNIIYYYRGRSHTQTSIRCIVNRRSVSRVYIDGRCTIEVDLDAGGPDIHVNRRDGDAMETWIEDLRNIAVLKETNRTLKRYIEEDRNDE